MEKRIKLLVTGDFFLESYTSDTPDKSINKYISEDVTALLNRSDLAIVNLEAPLTKSVRKINKTGPSLKMDPSSLLLLKHAGFNLLTLANNHIMDFGEEGLDNTLSLCKSLDMRYVGAGYNLEEAKMPFTTEINGVTLTILNFCENEWSTATGNQSGANPFDIIENYYSIKSVRQKSDFVCVIFHGGHENYSLPSPGIKRIFRFFIDLGADAVIGHHTHCTGGYEIYKGKPVIYSLGDLLFDRGKTKNKVAGVGLAADFTFSKNNLDFKVIPFYNDISGTNTLKLLSSEEKEKFFVRLDELNRLINDDEELENQFNEFCRIKKKQYEAFLEPHSCRLLQVLQSRSVIPSFLSAGKRRLYRNLIRCESHREIVLRILSYENRDPD